MAAKIDAVLPLTLQDYERSDLLRESLRRFFADLGTCWVVVRDDEFDQITTMIKDSKYRVIPESAIIPELGFYNFLRRVASRSHKPTSGYHVQQLIKLAIAAFVDTEFYLTLDADVICIRPVRASDLISAGRAITHRYPLSLHLEWYLHAERVLGLRRSGWSHAVTPSLLNREAMLKFQRYLERRVNPVLRFLAFFLPQRSRLKANLVSWRSYLIRNLPWTEYSLYNTFLEAFDLYESYYAAGSGSMVYGNGVWERGEFPSWDPGANARPDEPNFFFTVVQSHTGVSVREVRERVRKYLEHQ